MLNKSKKKNNDNMKKAIIFLNGFLVLAFILVTLNMQAQGISLGATRTGLNPGDTLMVPLRITGTGIYSGDIDFNYDQSVLAPQASVFSQVYFPTPMGLSWTANPYYPTNIYYFNFTSNSSGGTPLPAMTNRLIGYFCFIYTGGTSGTTTIHLRRSPGDATPDCGFYDNQGHSITIANYSTDFSISGSTGISSITLSSVSSGGPFDWDDPTAWVPSSGPAGVLSPAACFNCIVTGDEVDINGSTPGPARCNNLTINSAGKLTIDPNLSGSIVLSPGGIFTIQSGGSFIDNDGNTLTAAVSRAMTGDWVPGSSTYHAHLISSPVSGQSNSIFNGSIMNKWNETAQTWNPLTMPYITMGVGTGYDVSPVSPGITATFSGPLNTGDLALSGLTISGTPSNANWYGYNIIGNPYPSGMSWNNTYITNRSNLDASAWIWNYSGNYIPYTLTTGVTIAAEQGFFVHVTSSPGTGSLTIKNAGRTHGGTFAKSTVSDLLTLRVDGNNYWDQAQVCVNSQVTTGYDPELDARKMMGSADAPQLYSITPDYDLSINTLPSLDANNAIPFGFLAGTSGTFTMTASGMETFSGGQDFYLEDLLTSNVQNLNANPVYTFSASPGQPAHRFNLHFAPLGVNDITGSNIRIYSSEQSIYVNIPFSLRGDIIVYNVMGIELARKAIIGNSLNVINTSLSTGYYIVKVLGDSQSASGKVFIK